MAQILLHKQKLTTEQINKLSAEGVIAIRTNHPEDFKFLDVRVPQIQSNDMIWACLDALNTATTYTTEARRKLVENLADLAKDYRTNGKVAEHDRT